MTDAALETAAEEALERCPFARDADRLAEPPSLEGVYQVNTNRDGDPVYVPLVEVDLETADEPDPAVAYRIVAEVLRRPQPTLRDEHVRQYDVVFAYGNASRWDWEGGERRRIAVRPRQAERLAREPDFGPVELRDRLEDLDDGDDGIPPIALGEAPEKWGYAYADDDWSWLFFVGGAG